MIYLAILLIVAVVTALAVAAARELRRTDQFIDQLARGHTPDRRRVTRMLAAWTRDVRR